MGKLALVLIGLLIVVSLIASTSDKTPPPPNPNWIEDASTKSALTTLIKGYGYNCPTVKLAFREGADVYGNVVKVWCGPNDREGVYQNLVFRVTSRANGGWLVGPWKD